MADPAHWAEACEGDGWRNWPVITPPLRRTLPLLPPDEQSALLLDLEAGGGDLFLYENAAGERELSAWPLPPNDAATPTATPREELVVEDAIRACAAAGEAQVLRGIAALSRAEAAKPHQAEANRLRKLLLKLESEKKRLSDMVAAQDAARLLQSQLYRFSAEEKHASVTLDGAGGPVDLALDPRLTVRENMASLFHKASRGKRGLSMLEGRFAAVQADLARAEQAGLMAQAATSAPDARQRTLSRRAAVPRSGNCPRTYSRSAAATASCSFGAATPRGTPSFSSWQPRTISGCIPAVGRARTS